MRVLQVNKLYYPETGGIENTVQQIAEGLNTVVDMTVLVSKQFGRPEIQYINKVKVIKAGSIGILHSVPISLSFFYYFYKLSKKHEIIHIHMPFPLADLACLLSGYKGKIIVWYHSDILRQKKWLRLYKPLLYWLLKRADKIIVATQGNINGSVYLKQYQHKCEIIPFGVNSVIEKASLKYINNSAAFQEIKKNVRFLFVGRLVYYKGCDVLIKAFKNIPNVSLKIIGDGVLKKRLIELVHENHLEHCVEFLGNVNQKTLIQHYKECDVLVFPSNYNSEAFGLVQIEAMSFGKPIINTRLSTGVPYVSRHMDTGLTVTPNDVNELREAIIWMCKHPEERKKMGQRALLKVKKEYSLDIMLRHLYKTYEEILEDSVE